MLINDIEKLIRQLREEQGMTQEDARKKAINRALAEREDVCSNNPEYDYHLGGYPAPPPNNDEQTEEDTPLEGDIPDEKSSRLGRFFRRFLGNDDSLEGDVPD